MQTDDESDVQRQAIWSLLDALRVGGEAWSEKRPAKSDAAYSSATKGDVIRQQDLENLFNHNWNDGTGSFPEDKYLIIDGPDTDPHAVAAIWCRWDFTKKPLEFGCYLGIWSKANQSDDGAMRQKNVFLGFRFETPEEKGSNHKYHHAQPCKSMDKRKEPIAEAIALSVKFPTFPLIARTPTELVINAAISLHGKDCLFVLQNIINEIAIGIIRHI